MICCEIVVETGGVNKDDTAAHEARLSGSIIDKCMLEGYCTRGWSVADRHGRSPQKSVNESAFPNACRTHDRNDDVSNPCIHSGNDFVS